MPTRTDRRGLFWEDPDKVLRGNNVNRTPPPVPDTGWTIPRDFPNLSGAKVLCIDVETKDPDLKSRGPGDIRRDGHIVGIAVGVPEKQWYFPIRHEHGDNLDPEPVIRWARDTFSGDAPKIGANLLYDLHWLDTEDIKVGGPKIDVQWTEAIIDEYAQSYELGVLGMKYTGESKDESALYEWCSLAFGGNSTRAQQAKNIYRAPAALVGPYAESDVRLPLQIWEQQRKIIEQEHLWGIWRIEHRLMPLYFEMRKRGMKYDQSRVDYARRVLTRRKAKWERYIRKVSGYSVDIWSAGSIARVFDRLGLSYNRTAPSKSYPKGQPSFTGTWLEQQAHPVARMITKARKADKAIATYLDGYIADKGVNGRVHASLHPLRRATDSEGGAGTVSGRFSYSNPNLQNIPSRDKMMSRLIRGCFVPDDSDACWTRGDYSQIEYRLTAHYAKGPKSEELRAQYNADPTTDYHELTRQLIYDVTGILLERKPTKNINFGLLYGMGQKKLVRSLGLSEAKGEQLYDSYHSGVPFVKATTSAIIDRARQRGYIKTILGRRARFPFWEPLEWDLRHIGMNRDPRIVEEQIQKYSEGANYRQGVVRAKTHKAPNSLMQGGAADIMKKAMLDLYEAGIFDATGVPLVTVHDELDFSNPGTPAANAAFEEAKRIMENAVPELRVPLLIDFDSGPTWGDC